MGVFAAVIFKKLLLVFALPLFPGVVGSATGQFNAINCCQAKPYSSGLVALALGPLGTLLLLRFTARA